MLTEDVSYRGCFLRTDSPPPLRTLVQVKLVLPPGNVAIKAHGMIVHYVEPLNPADRVPGVGVQFYGLDSDTRETWDQFVRFVEERFPRASDQMPLSLPDGTPEPIRRRFARHTTVLRVDVRSLDELRDLVVRDVSRGGMFIETDSTVAVGQEVMVNLHHPERSDTLLLDAVVRRIQKQPAPGAGVEFVKMDDERREEVMHFVHGGVVVDESPRIVDPGDPHLL
jgi:uncharacterized protein (TIGR02266 family)